MKENMITAPKFQYFRRYTNEPNSSAIFVAFLFCHSVYRSASGLVPFLAASFKATSNVGSERRLQWAASREMLGVLGIPVSSSDLPLSPFPLQSPIFTPNPPDFMLFEAAPQPCLGKRDERDEQENFSNFGAATANCAS